MRIFLQVALYRSSVRIRKPLCTRHERRDSERSRAFISIFSIFRRKESGSVNPWHCWSADKFPVHRSTAVELKLVAGTELVPVFLLYRKRGALVVVDRKTVTELCINSGGEGSTRTHETFALPPGFSSVLSMFDARQTTTRRSPRRVSLDGSENECEGRLSLGTGGPPSDCAANPASKGTAESSSRSPLTVTNNGGDTAAAAAAAALTAAAVTPSKAKPPTAPGVSRFGFKPPPGASLSPRRPGGSNTSTGSTGSQSQEGGGTVITRAAAASLLSPPRAGGGSASGGAENKIGRTATAGGGGATAAAIDAARPAGRTTRSRAAMARTGGGGAEGGAGGAGGGGRPATLRGGRSGTNATSNSSGSGNSGGGGGSGRGRRAGTAPAGAGVGRANTRSAASGTAAPSSRRLSVRLCLLLIIDTAVCCVSFGYCCWLAVVLVG